MPQITFSTKEIYSLLEIAIQIKCKIPCKNKCTIIDNITGIVLLALFYLR